MQAVASVSHQFTVNRVSETTSTDAIVNVLKRRETVAYRGFLPTEAANIAYVANDPIRSDVNLSIFDRSATLPANRIENIPTTFLIQQKLFNINTENFLVTDVFTETLNSIEKTPLFYRHILSTENLDRQDDDIDGLTLAANAKLLSVKVLDSSFQEILSPEIVVDYDWGIVYTNLISSYSATNDYSIYYVEYAINIGNEIKTYIDLLDSQPIFRVATFEDLTFLLELKEDGRKAYLIEEVSGGFLVTLPSVTDYAFKPKTTSRITIQPPVAATTEESWYVRVTNGRFYSNILGSLHKYHIAEFSNQEWNPSEPIKAIVDERSIVLADTLIKLDNENIYETDELKVYIEINDADDVGVAAFTTDSSVHGNIADNGQPYRKWNEIDRFGIRSIDHATGILDIDGFTLKSNYQVISTYWFTETNYEFNLVDFNPINNREALKTQTSLFVDPDTTFTEKTQTLYFLKTDEVGRVIESNWTDFASGMHISGKTLYYEEIPDFLVTGVSEYGLPNWVDPSGILLFVPEFTAEGEGNFLILGDISVSEGSSIDDLTVIDSRRRGGGIVDTEFEDTRLLQPELEWYWDEGYWDGLPFPGNASFFVEVPADVLEGAGGGFTGKQVRDIVERHTAAGVYPLARAYGIDVLISGINLVPSGVTLHWISDDF